MTISERIRRRREQLNMSQEELAIKLGYKSRSSINKIEKDAHGLPQSKIKAIADALETSPSYIMGWEEQPENTVSIPIADNIFPITRKKYPLLGDIACGEPIFADEQYDSYIVSDCDVKADFCLRCKGDSMINARIEDGDIVFIRKQPMVENGEIAAVIIEDEATLKRVYYYPEENRIVLSAENPHYSPFVYVGEELNHITILGKAVAFQSDIG